MSFGKGLIRKKKKKRKKEKIYSEIFKAHQIPFHQSKSNC